MICALGLRREHMDPYSRYVHVQHRYINHHRYTWNPGGHIVSLKVFDKMWHLTIQNGVSELSGFPYTPRWGLEP